MQWVERGFGVKSIRSCLMNSEMQKRREIFSNSRKNKTWKDGNNLAKFIHFFVAVICVTDLFQK